MSRAERIALALGSIGFVFALIGASGCANMVDVSRKGMTAAYQVAMASRTALDTFDIEQQQKIMASVTTAQGSKVSIDAARSDLAIYRAKRDKVAAVIDLLYAGIGTAALAATAVEAKQAGAEVDLAQALAQVYNLALQVKSALATLGINIGGGS